MSAQGQRGDPNGEPPKGSNEAPSGAADEAEGSGGRNGTATRRPSARAPKTATPKTEQSAKRGRGRPKGSKTGAKPSEGTGAQAGDATGTIIKKYANRRLYDTSASRYVTLEDLALMVREGTEFTVQDARTGEDITRSVLGQIIFEQEAKDGQSLLPTAFLRQVISYYGDQMGAVVPSYLEQSMAAFQEGQDEMRRQFASVMGGKLPDPGRMSHGMAELAAAPLKAIEEQTRRNAEAFAEAMRMFSPFDMGGAAGSRGANDGASFPKPSEGTDAAPTERKDEDDAGELAELREQIAAMQRKMDRLGE